MTETQRRKRDFIERFVIAHAHRVADTGVARRFTVHEALRHYAAIEQHENEKVEQ